MRLIDADAPKETLRRIRTELVKHPTFLRSDIEEGIDKGIGAAMQAIDDAPTIDAMPVVHGRWIKMTGMMPSEYHGHYECSECQWHMKGLRNSWTREEELLYCPNCGAKMDGERRDNGE